MLKELHTITPQTIDSFLVEITKPRSGDPETGPIESIEGIDTEGCRVVYTDMQNPEALYTKTSFYESGRKEYSCNVKNGQECGAYTSYHDLEGSPVEIESTVNKHDPEEFVGNFKRFAPDGTLVEQTQFNERGKEVGAYFVIDSNGIRDEGTHDSNGSELHVGLQRKKDALGNMLVEIEHAFDPKPRVLSYFYRFADNSTVKGFLDSSCLGPKDIFHLLQINHSADELYGDKEPEDYFIGHLDMRWPDGSVKRKCLLVPSHADELEKIERGLFVEYYEDGALKRIGDTEQGTDFRYHPDGKPQGEKVVKDGRFLLYKEWDKDGNITLTHHHGKGLFDITVQDKYDTNKKLLSKDHFLDKKPVNTLAAHLLEMIEHNRYDIATLDIVGISAEDAASRIRPSGFNLKG